MCCISRCFRIFETSDQWQGVQTVFQTMGTDTVETLVHIERGLSLWMPFLGSFECILPTSRNGSNLPDFGDNVCGESVLFLDLDVPFDHWIGGDNQR